MRMIIKLSRNAKMDGKMCARAFQRSAVLVISTPPRQFYINDKKRERNGEYTIAECFEA
jgi:hypothetical protein